MLIFKHEVYCDQILRLGLLGGVYQKGPQDWTTNEEDEQDRDTTLSQPLSKSMIGARVLTHVDLESNIDSQKPIFQY